MNLMNLQKDQEFMARLADTSDISAIKELLASKGIAMTDEEIDQAIKLSETELSEDALENVAGGFAEIYAGICILALVIGLVRGSRCR